MSEKTKRGLEISITAVFVLALLLVGAVLIFSGGTASAKQFATLRLLGGQVAVQRGNGAFETGEDGMSLREGDTVRTGPDGRASIEYFDGSLTRLDFDTSFTLVTLETLGNAAASKVIEGSQVDGNSYHRVAELADADSRFAVETPTATASAHGTGYAVLVDQGSTTIAVVEGVVTAWGPPGPWTSARARWWSWGPTARRADPRPSPRNYWTASGSPSTDATDHAPATVSRARRAADSPGEQPGDRTAERPEGEQGSLPPSATTGAGGPGGTTGGGLPPAAPPTARPAAARGVHGISTARSGAAPGAVLGHLERPGRRSGLAALELR